MTCDITYLEYCWTSHGREQSPSPIPSLKLDIQKWIATKWNDENYQHVVRHDFWQVWWSIDINSTHFFRNSSSPKARAGLWKYIMTGVLLNFSMKWGGPNGDFLESSGIWCNLSIMYYEFILSNNSSFAPQHYLQDVYILIFALIYTLEL